SVHHLGREPDRDERNDLGKGKIEHEVVPSVSWAGWSEFVANGAPPGPRITWLTCHEPGVARAESQEIEVLLVEGVAHPAVDVETVIGAEANPEVAQRVAVDPAVDRRRRVRREPRAVAAVVAEVGFAIDAEQRDRHVAFGAERERPLGHAGQPLAGDVAVRRADTARGTRRARRLARCRRSAAGEFR